MLGFHARALRLYRGALATTFTASEIHTKTRLVLYFSKDQKMRTQNDGNQILMAANAGGMDAA